MMEMVLRFVSSNAKTREIFWHYHLLTLVHISYFSSKQC